MRILRRSPRGHGDHARGQILVMFGLGLTVFLGFAALTIDIGFLLVNHRSYQNAADASALAGATYLTRPIADPCADISGGGSKHDCAREASWRYLRDDLRLTLTDPQIATLKTSNTTAAGELIPTTDGSDDYRLWVSSPPAVCQSVSSTCTNGAGLSASMSTVGDKSQVMFVRVDRNRSTFVAGVLGLGDFNVSAWATAGIFPNRFAVITLRRGRGSTEIDPGPANTTDIKLAGTNSMLTVVDGDVGGNWGMKLGASSELRLVSTGADEVNAYLIDYLSCGNSCWSVGQVKDENGNPIAPKRLPSFVPDPNYEPPPIPGATWPNGLVDNIPLGPAVGTWDIPNGDTDTTPYAGPAPNIRIRQGSVTAAGKCVGPDGLEASAPRLGPGTYGNIRVDTRNCVILDPVRRFTDPELGFNGLSTSSPTTAWSWVPDSQFAGIYYVTGNFDIQTDSLIVGDGVTVIIRPPGQYRPSGGGAMDLNRGLVVPGDQKLGGWTTKGAPPYLHDGSRWNYQDAQEGDARLYGVGIAIYVLKPTQAGITDSDGTDVIDVSSGSALAWNGITYAPNDNVKIAGQPNHDGVGQLVSWTFTFNGGTAVTQTFDGPGDGFPYLIEPCIQVAGSCQ